MIEVFDNFLPKTYHKELLEILNGPDFPWFYNSNISDEEEEGMPAMPPMGGGGMPGMM